MATDQINVNDITKNDNKVLDIKDGVDIKEGSITHITDLSSFENLTAEDVAAFEIDPKIEAEVRWQYDKVCSSRLAERRKAMPCTDAD